MKQPKPPARTADKQPSEVLPDPTRPTLWAALVYALATLTLAYPALAGKILFNPHSDQYLAGYGFREFAAQSLRAGKGFPQWNPFLQGGLPYIGAMHGDIFYPTFLLRMIMPTATAMTWEFPLHLFLARLFTFLFLRAWSFRFYPALIGGLAYMLGGSIAGYASPGHDGKLFVSALLPLALLLLTRGMRDGRKWSWGALAIVIGLAFLSPAPQPFQYLLLVAGCFALWLAFSSREGQGKPAMAEAIKSLGLAASSVAVGLAIGAIQYLPSLFEYKPWSPRAAGHDWTTATSYSFPIEETLNAYVPQFSGILSNYWGQNGIHLHSDYFGVVVLMLFGAAFGATKHASFRRFWVGTGIVSLLWAFGGHTPLYHLILYVPQTKYLRAPSIMIYVTAFAIAMLVAIGMERLQSRRVGTKYAAGWGIGAALFALFISVGGYHMLVKVAVSIIGTNFDSRLASDSLDYYQYAARAEDNTAAVVLGAWRSFIFVALASGTIWAFATKRIGQKVTAIAIAALLVVDLWSIERLYWLFSPPASVTFASDPAADAIKADIAKSGESGRTLAVTLGPLTGIEPLDPAFRGGAFMALGIRTVQGYHGNELDMYRQLLLVDSGRVLVTPELWRHENVRYLYTGMNEGVMAQATSQFKWGAATKLAGPVRDAAGSMVYAYRLPGNNPPAWVAGGAVSVTPEQAMPTVLDPRFDPARAALVDTGTAIKASQSLPAPSTVTARVKTYEAGHISIDLSAPPSDGSVLVVSENYYPGWKATSESGTLTTSRVNYNLIGVALTPSTRHVELTFTDQSYGPGKSITLVALSLAVIALAIGAVMDRRVPSPPAPTAA